jgi:hypothetical protein
MEPQVIESRGDVMLVDAINPRENDANTDVLKLNPVECRYRDDLFFRDERVNGLLLRRREPVLADILPQDLPAVHDTADRASALLQRATCSQGSAQAMHEEAHAPAEIPGLAFMR